MDGKPSQQIPVDDRGLLLADGAFETFLVREGTVMYVDEHRERLARSLGVLQFSTPQQFAQGMIAESAALIAAVGTTGSARLTVTRGSGPRGYSPPVDAVPRSLLSFDPLFTPNSAPLTLGWSTVKWPDQPLLSGAKLLARTENILAALDARQQQVDDVVMCTQDDRVCSVARGNLFLRVADTLLTPDLSTAGIAGTRRALILNRFAKVAGYHVTTASVARAQLLAADEIFVCNALWGVRPVARIGQQQWSDFAASRALAPLLDPEAAVTW